MTRTVSHHTFCFLLSVLIALAFVSALASSPAWSQGFWDHDLGPRGTVFTAGQGQANSAQPRTPSMSRPGRARSGSLSDKTVHQELSLSDDQ